MAAQMRKGESALSFHFTTWRQAVAFDSGRCCRVYGVEIENARGEVFQRICLAKGIDLDPFVEWTQTHQATGVELEDTLTDIELEKQQPPVPALVFSSGSLEISPDLLKTILITAAQREIPLTVGVVTEGASQIARIDVRRASEAHGWLVLSGENRSLYVQSEPAGSLLVEPRTVGDDAI
jgi:hypothetical protein